MKKYVEEIEEEIKNEDGKKIGYLQICEFYEGYDEHDFDEEIEEGTELAFVYLSSIGIDEAYRNKGYGEKTLKGLAKRYGSFYLTSENAKCRHLYERLGEAVPYHKIPRALQGNADTACLENDDGEVDKDFSGMYIIEGE